MTKTFHNLVARELPLAEKMGKLEAKLDNGITRECASNKKNEAEEKFY